MARASDKRNMLRLLSDKLHIYYIHSWKPKQHIFASLKNQIPSVNTVSPRPHRKLNRVELNSNISIWSENQMTEQCCCHWTCRCNTLYLLFGLGFIVAWVIPELRKCTHGKGNGVNDYTHAPCLLLLYHTGLSLFRWGGGGMTRPCYSLKLNSDQSRAQADSISKYISDLPFASLLPAHCQHPGEATTISC